jgi:hypothetical protein
MNVILQSLNVDENKPDEIKSPRRSGIPEKDIFQDEGKTEATKMADRIWQRVLTKLEKDKKSS